MSKKTLLVMSGKGGVGKTTIAVNIAYKLSKEGNSVGILDADIHGPNVLKILGSKGTFSIEDKKIMPIKVQDIKVVSMAGIIDEESAVIWRGPMKHNALKQFIQDVEWGDLDYLIVDFPPGTGDELLSAAQLLKDISGAVIVSTPQSVSLLDMMRSVDFCKKMNIPIIGLIENMSGNIFGKGTVKEICSKNNLQYLGSLPLSEKAVRSSEEGKSFMNYDDKELIDSFENIIKNIKESLNSKGEE